jgi:hypothetical protein
MSLRVLLLVVVTACSSNSMQTKKGEPQTAREKMLAEQKQHPEPEEGGTGKKWSKWRYQGERKDCRYVVGGKCFKTESAACQAAKCKAPLKCASEGAGPAKLKCAKEE